jgi:flagellar FliL protein
VKNDLLMLFGGQKYEDLSTRAGKEKLQKDALASVRSIIEKAGGKPESIEALYFTSFVMQ